MAEKKEIDFFTSIEREELARATDRIIDYVRKEKIGDILIAGASGAYARDLFRMRWKKRFPEDPAPHFFSLGKTVNNVFCDKDSAAYLRSRRDTLKKFGKWEERKKAFGRVLFEKFGERFFDAMRTRKVLLLDEFENSTDSIGTLKEILGETVRTRDLKKGVLVGHQSGYPADLDVVGLSGGIPRFYRGRNHLRSRNHAKNVVSQKNHKRIREGLGDIAGTGLPAERKVSKGRRPK